MTSDVFRGPGPVRQGYRKEKERKKTLWSHSEILPSPPHSVWTSQAKRIETFPVWCTGVTVGVVQYSAWGPLRAPRAPPLALVSVGQQQRPVGPACYFKNPVSRQQDVTFLQWSGTNAAAGETRHTGKCKSFFCFLFWSLVRYSRVLVWWRIGVASAPAGWIEMKRS